MLELLARLGAGAGTALGFGAALLELLELELLELELLELELLELELLRGTLVSEVGADPDVGVLLDVFVLVVDFSTFSPILGGVTSLLWLSR
ncbi:MAG: hypothetical protein AB7N76_35055 [Planctomycetota bacterium]